MSVTHWWYNTESGQLSRSNIATQALQSLGSVFGLSAGWHELNIPGSATAAQAAAEAKREFPNGATPTNAGISPARVAGLAGNEAGISATGTIDDLINFLKQGSIWTRVVEVGAGLIILYIGLKAISTPKGQTVSVQSPSQVAKNLRKPLIKK